jgi:hypothetical protein
MPTPTLGIAQWLYGRLNELLSWLVSLGLSGKLRWVAEYWLVFVVGILLFGISIDLVVYVVRYRPHIKWARRIKAMRDASARRKAASRVADDSAAMPPRKREAPPQDKRRVPPASPEHKPTMQDEPPTRAREQGASPRRQPDAPTRPQAPPPKRSPASRAELFQPAPPAERYDDEPRTYDSSNATRAGQGRVPRKPHDDAPS